MATVASLEHADAKARIPFRLEPLLNSRSAAVNLVPAFVVTLAGLGLVSIVITAVSPSGPGEYTTGWLLSPFIGMAGIAAVGYFSGRVAESTRAGFGAVVGGAITFVTGLALVYAPDWAGGAWPATVYAYVLVGPLVIALMIPTYALARHQAAIRTSQRQREGADRDDFGRPWG